MIYLLHVMSKSQISVALEIFNMNIPTNYCYGQEKSKRRTYCTACSKNRLLYTQVSISMGEQPSGTIKRQQGLCAEHFYTNVFEVQNAMMRRKREKGTDPSVNIYSEPFIWRRCTKCPHVTKQKRILSIK